MDSAKKICPYCGEEIQAAAKKCKYCGEWLDKEDLSNSESPIVHSHPNTSQATEKKVKIMNIAIALLVIANIAVGIFFFKSRSQSVVNKDIAKASELLKKKDLQGSVDSLSYAIGSFIAASSGVSPNSGLSSSWDPFYAGMYRGLITPISVFTEDRRTAIKDGLNNVTRIDIDDHSSVGSLNGEIIFQGIFDVSTKGRTPLISNEESIEMTNKYLKF